MFSLDHDVQFDARFATLNTRHPLLSDKVGVVLLVFPLKRPTAGTAFSLFEAPGAPLLPIRPRPQIGATFKP